MIRRLSFAACAALVLVASAAAAQQPGPHQQPRPPRAPDAGAADAGVPDAGPDAGDETDEEGGGDDHLQLRPPDVHTPDLTGGGVTAPDEGDEGDEGDGGAQNAAEVEGTHADGGTAHTEGDETLVSPEQDEHRLDETAAASQRSDPTAAANWTAPSSTLTLHGYFRVRGELQDHFYLGHAYGGDGLSRPIEPFVNFVPVEHRSAAAGMSTGYPVAGVAGGCGATVISGSTTTNNCDQRSLSFANMRLRLMPTLNLGDDIRIHTWFDVFDNVILGSTPEAWSGGVRSPFTPLNIYGSSMAVPSQGQNWFTNSIVARRVWAEVRNRSLGELRFGRMGFHWGLGMVANAGDNLDGDYSTDVDRVMAITKLAGIYLMAAYDFAGSGFSSRYRLLANANGPATLVDGAVPYDPSQLDNISQLFFAAARRSTPEEQSAALARGDFVLNGGAFLLYRNQFFSGEGSNYDVNASGTPSFIRRRAEIWLPDLWGQLLWGKLRVEAEFAAVLGHIQNTDIVGMSPASTGAPQNLGLMQFGATLDAEYRLLDDKLGIYFNTGYATGDAGTLNDGVGASADTVTRSPVSPGGNISTFRFHPNYRIDLILWRTILRQVSGAYYFRPGVSYDFIHGPFGQLLGGRVDAVYSRASVPVQTWGNSPDLGIEFDASVYYRSEDGPELLDGFYAIVQYGLLIPMQGLGWLPNEVTPANPSLSNAQTVRIILGVMF